MRSLEKRSSTTVKAHIAAPNRKNAAKTLSIVEPSNCQNECHVTFAPKRDRNQQAAKTVQKITGSGKVRGEDLVSSEELKRKFRTAKKQLRSRNNSRAHKN